MAMFIQVPMHFHLIGEWKDDMASGNGKYTDVIGMEYIGEWKNDKQNGTGNSIRCQYCRSREMA